MDKRTVDCYFYLSYDVWISSNLKMEEKKTKPLAPTGDPSHNMPTSPAVMLLVDLRQGPLRGIF
jgi:hypothetical protein